ncbi:type III-B CRISPR module-associated protein Cmr3 [Chloroflexota bacterium]|nr:type III-B CRISPR module-associated protein Cmr3 [Chloroflexota bacterium]
MSWFYIEPSDVLFFRDSRPFGAGEDHLATSIFPPNPRTVAGAFRSLYLGHSKVDWKDFTKSAPSAASVQSVIGSPAGFEDSAFTMQGPFLVYRTGNLFNLHTKLPSDSYLIPKEVWAQGHKEFQSYSPVKSSTFSTNWPKSSLHPLWPPNGERKDNPKEIYWLQVDGISSYKKGGAFSAKLESEVISFEPRIGNARDRITHSTRDEHLYQATYIRMKPSYGFLVRLNKEFDTLPNKGNLILGGEFKAANYERVKTDINFNFGLEKATNRLKVVLMTPAFFTAGWEPARSDWSSVLGIPAKLIAVALGKPLYLGGYDVARHKQRAIYPFIPPGSVFFFETDKPIQQLNRPFTESPTPEMPLDRMGYGQAFLGQWDWQTPEEEN